MKKLPILMLVLLAFVACKSNKALKNTEPASSKWKHYSCEWFDFDYPSYFQTSESRNAISDTIPGLKEGGEVVLYAGYLPYRFRFVKSCMFDVFDSPKGWRDYSIETKEMGLAEGSDKYLGIFTEEDSLTFQGHPASSVTFAYLEDGDTIAQHQLVVMTQPSKNVYYLNYIAPISVFDSYSETADSIFESIKLR